MIKVSGMITLRTEYTVELDMTQEEFDTLPLRKQNQLIDSTVNWHDVLRDADTDEIEIDLVEEVD